MICTRSHAGNCLSSRFTDFVVQMQEKIGQGLTLCDVVGHEKEIDLGYFVV